MSVLHIYSKVDTYLDEEEGRVVGGWEEGDIYQLLECPSCERVILRRDWYHEFLSPTRDDHEILYPAQERLPAGLPQEIETAYEAALRVQNVDANAFGVLLGRVIELVCEDRGAKGPSLNARLKDLASKGEIPSKLVDVSHGLRQLRNIGAHPTLGELTTAEVPILQDLTRAVLEYVYSAPLLARKAIERYEDLTARREERDLEEE